MRVTLLLFLFHISLINSLHVTTWNTGHNHQRLYWDAQKLSTDLLDDIIIIDIGSRKVGVAAFNRTMMINCAKLEVARIMNKNQDKRDIKTRVVDNLIRRFGEVKHKCTITEDVESLDRIFISMVIAAAILMSCCTRFRKKRKRNTRNYSATNDNTLDVNYDSDTSDDSDSDTSDDSDSD